MNYFSDCLNMNDAKKRFRELSKKHHPDVGGDAKTFAEISNQYDRFNPSQQEHTNYYGNYNSSYGYSSFADRVKETRDRMRQAQEAYNNAYSRTGSARFNTTNLNSEIPFDHPIHQKIKDLEYDNQNLQKGLKNSSNDILLKERQIQELNNIIEAKSQDINHKITKIFELKEEIESLKSQIEVLTRPRPSCTMLDKIRSYFEKQSEV